MQDSTRAIISRLLRSIWTTPDFNVAEKVANVPFNAHLADQVAFQIEFF